MSTLGLEATSAVSIVPPSEANTVPGDGWKDKLRFAVSLIGTIATGNRQAVDSEELPVIEMVRFESPLAVEVAWAREHLRYVGESLTLCGSESSTWAAYHDGRLKPGKECPFCIQAAYNAATAYGTPDTAGGPELRLVA